MFAALQAVHGAGDRLRRFACCGSDAWVQVDKANPTHFAISANYCHDRFCQPCASLRSRIIAANLQRVIEDVPHRFITLTLRSEHEPLSVLMPRLYGSFARLRRSKLWREHVAGGAAFCEIKRSRDRERWHVHLHIIATGKFLPQRLLSRQWLQITGDSYIVDVRLIRDHDETVRYITKYASKPLDPSFSRIPALLAEAVEYLGGRRLCLTFGTWRGVRLTEVQSLTDWKPLAPLSDVRAWAAAGDAYYQRVLAALLHEQSDVPTSPDDPAYWDS